MAAWFLDRHVQEGRGSKTAILYEGVSISYVELLELVNRVGNGLKTLGVGKGDRVLLLLPDSPEFVACYLGAAKIGAVAVPTNTSLKSDDFRYFLQESDARIAVFDHSLLPKMEELVKPGKFLITGTPDWADWVSAQ